MDYRWEQARLHSFFRWPHTIWTRTITPIAFAAAGLYFTGSTDRVKCFECGIEIFGWVDGDIPRIIHDRLEPRCRFVRNKRCGNMPLGAIPPVNSTPSQRPNIDHYRPVYDAIREFNETQELPVRVIMSETAPIQTVTTVTVSSSTTDTANSTRSGNQQTINTPGPSNPPENPGTMEESLLCKVCLERNLQIVFFPCGHIVTCKKCAKQLKICCFCRQQIKNQRRIFIP